MSTPHTTPAPVDEYTRIVDDLATVSTEYSTGTPCNGPCPGPDHLEPVSKIAAFLPILAERIAGDHLLAAAEVDGTIATGTPEILFVCVHNAGRSQMAAGLLTHLSGGDVEVRSAGKIPGGQVNPPRSRRWPRSLRDVLTDRHHCRSPSTLRHSFA